MKITSIMMKMNVKFASVVAVVFIGFLIYSSIDRGDAFNSEVVVDNEVNLFSGDLVPYRLMIGNESADTNEAISETPSTLGLIKPFDQASAYLQNDPSIWFPDAETLSDPGHSEETYIASLHSLLDEYVIIIKSGYPIGLNIEITNALLGENSKKVAILEQSHPRINVNGELIDQWGTPYFFHFQSQIEMTIHSAGADGKMYTEDDISSDV